MTCGDFIEEREKIKRILERKLGTDLKIDYSNFSNHVFYDSAYQKFSIAQKRILTTYPYNAKSEDKESFFLTGSGYENYVFNYQWPKFVGTVTFTTGSVDTSNSYISASDYDNKLNLGSSSLYVSVWMNNLKFGGSNALTNVLQVISASVGSSLKYGYELILSSSGAGLNPFIRFNLFSRKSDGWRKLFL